MLAFLFLLVAVILFVLDAVGVGANRRLLAWGLAAEALAFLIGASPAIERFV